MTGPQLRLTVKLNPSVVEARRGIARVHPEVLTALGLREWDAMSLTGARVTAVVVAAAPRDAPTGVVLLDDITLSNTGLKEDAQVVVGPVAVHGAGRVTVAGSALASQTVDETTLRRALLGKVLSIGDTTSLLPRDLGPEFTASDATRKLAASVGITWTNELLTVVDAVSAADAGPVSVQPNTAVLWSTTAPSSTTPATRPSGRFASVPPQSAPEGTVKIRPVAELVGVDTQVAKLTEWLRITLDEPEVLAALGAAPRLGVLITGPAGVGKATVVRAVCASRTVATIDGPTTGALAAQARSQLVNDTVRRLGDDGGVLLITDVDALLPTGTEPVSTLILDTLRTAIAEHPIALICTTANPAGVDVRLRDPSLCDRELIISLPDAATRGRLLAAILTGVPTDGDLNLDDIATHTPGFVAADLAALTREAAMRAAARVSSASGEKKPALTATDLQGALAVIRPVSRAESPEVAVGSITLDDVGDMVETRQSLTEAVLWPLRHPDTFARLGVQPPRGVLLYGPPGCGKTFVVRALAASGQLSVHTVKGAELMDKWVGSSEKAVRDLFSRARQSAPSLIFLDEIDALAPRRGQSSDSGVSDRVVAALLTELDGVEPLSDVVVLGATNRPELIDPALLRPGRLERLVFVPPPDADARYEILSTAGRNVPLSDDIDLRAVAVELDGYSAADCAALLRESALAAMRRDIDAATVTEADLKSARAAVRPSLDPAQVAHLAAYAERRDER